ncbi:RteC protein, partial [Bacteroides ovatus]
VAIPKPYDLRADLARRKKNYSVLLPKLKETFEKNIAACGNGK